MQNCCLHFDQPRVCSQYTHARGSCDWYGYDQATDSDVQERHFQVHGGEGRPIRRGWRADQVWQIRVGVPHNPGTH